MIRKLRGIYPDMLALILKEVPCGIIMTDQHLRINSFNQAAEKMTGWKEREALGKLCPEVLIASLGEHMCPLKKALLTGKSVDNEVVEIRSRSGARIPVHISVHVLRDRLGRIEGALEIFGDLSAIYALRGKLEGTFAFQRIVSNNHKMQRLFELLPRVAESGSTLLIRGESGTGKELFARAVHELSPRKHRKFKAVNCAALPDTLLEAELFGYVKGAFTDARENREGRVAAAEGGTLLLDEIGDVSPAIQVKLLRFLQDRRYEALGSSVTKQANVRIIVSTHRNLESLMEQGKFRSDFYFRLNVLSLEIPPLRERMDDVPLLIDHFRNVRSFILGKPIPPFSAEAMKCLLAYSYPGNVRELENIVERCTVLCNGPTLDLDLLPNTVLESVTKVAAPLLGEPEPSPEAHFSAAIRKARYEADRIERALVESGFSRNLAAEKLKMSRATLWRKMKKYSLLTGLPQ